MLVNCSMESLAQWGRSAHMRCYFNLVRVSDSIRDIDGVEVQDLELAIDDIVAAIDGILEEEPQLAPLFDGWTLEIAEATSGRVISQIDLAHPHSARSDAVRHA
jgi:hypothetical protein